MKRLFWMAAYIPCTLSHRVFGTSYKWVNAGKGAWHKELFDELWHYEWYGTPIRTMPESVNLGGHHWKVVAHEGLVQFIDEDHMNVPLIFERDPHDMHAHLWKFRVGGDCWASSIDYAYRWVEAVYGGSFEKKGGTQ